jgi:hypothetical protein
VIAECGELCRSRTKHGQSEGVLQGRDRRRHIRHGKADLTETLSLLPLGESKRSAPNPGCRKPTQQECSFPSSLLRGIVRAGTLLACRRSRSRLSHGSR